MSAPKVPSRGSREEQLTTWAFYFFMGGIALSFVFALVYLLTV